MAQQHVAFWRIGWQMGGLPRGRLDAPAIRMVRKLGRDLPKPQAFHRPWPNPLPHRVHMVRSAETC